MCDLVQSHIDNEFTARAPERIAALVAEVEEMQKSLLAMIKRKGESLYEDMRFVMSELDLSPEQRAKLPEVIEAMITRPI